MTWEAIRKRAETAETVGFDMFVYEDALLYRGEETTDGCWEAVSISAAVAMVTNNMHFGPSVFNSPYRSPAMLARIADTIDEISGGRFVFGIGAGNTPDSDYEAFGFPIDKRYSRFAEAIVVIHTLLHTGHVDFDGVYYTARDAELVLRGPRPNGPPINIAAGGSKMLRLVAMYADAWNWWGWDETLDQLSERITPIIEDLERACDEVGRDPSTLAHTFDLYSVVPPGFQPTDAMDQPVSGSAEEITEHLMGIGELGFDEIRCDLTNKTTDGIEAMRPVVDLVHAG
jgi:alkanesulfonate monooxygenase SsuD/methylene tetrahydromethanopterin reductase-like flavin-dependent oxidoreductase (luciferase family)